MLFSLRAGRAVLWHNEQAAVLIDTGPKNSGLARRLRPYSRKVRLLVVSAEDPALMGSLQEIRDQWQPERVLLPGDKARLALPGAVLTVRPMGTRLSVTLETEHIVLCTDPCPKTSKPLIWLPVLPIIAVPPGTALVVYPAPLSRRPALDPEAWTPLLRANARIYFAPRESTWFLSVYPFRIREAF